MKFFDIFKFFTEIELTDEMRRYELAAVITVCVLSFALTAVGIVRNRRRNREKKNDTE